MARDLVVRVRLTDECHVDLEEAAKSYGVAPATMATVIIGEWLDKRKRKDGFRNVATDTYAKTFEHLDRTMVTAEEIYGFLYVRRGMSFTGRDIPIRDIKDWERARGMLIADYSDRTEYLPTLRDWLDQTVAPRIRVVNT